MMFESPLFQGEPDRRPLIPRPLGSRALLGAILAVVVLVAPAIARGQESTDTSEPLVIGSKNFAESRLLAEIMAQLIEADTELEVERRPNLGGTLLVHRALVAGEIDLYPEYTGTSWAIVLKREETARDPLRTYLEVRRGYRQRFGVEWLEPFGFNNSYALAMREDVAQKLDAERISDLAELGATVRVGVSHEFLNREDGYPGLAETYDLDIENLRGMEHGLAYEAVESGKVDVIDVYTTDGKLARFNLRILEDDRRFFPPYDAAPLVRQEILERHPELGATLSRLAFRLPNERMQKLNYEVEVKRREPSEVAGEFLRDEGLLNDAGTPSQASDVGTAATQGFLPFFLDRLPETGGLVVEHLVLTGTAVFLAILFSVPVGILLTRKTALSGPVLGVAGIIQTIPSLALLAFMIPIPGLGLGTRSAVAALFLYAILPILRNTVTGIRQVDPELVEAARGMGLTDGQILRLVELPLALRTIMAGVRTSAVISIGFATLAAFIGAGGLGDPIVTGLQLNDTRLILAGAVPAALLAIVTDFVLEALETALSPTV